MPSFEAGTGHLEGTASVTIVATDTARSTNADAVRFVLKSLD